MATAFKNYTRVFVSPWGSIDSIASLSSILSAGACGNQVIVNSMDKVIDIFWQHHILGDPGATNRVDAIFSGESLLQELELILTESVPEVVEFCPADWPD